MTDLIPVLDVLDGDTDLIGHLVAHLGEVHGFESLRFTRHNGNVRICRDTQGIYGDVDVDGLFRGIGEDLRAAEVAEGERQRFNEPESSPGPYLVSDGETLIVKVEGADGLTGKTGKTAGVWPLHSYPVVDGRIIVTHEPSDAVTTVDDVEPDPVEPACSPGVQVPVEGGGPDGSPRLSVSGTVTPAVSDTGGQPTTGTGRGVVAGPGRVTRAEVSDYLAAHPWSKTSEIAGALNASMRDVSNRLQKLRMDGKASQTRYMWALSGTEQDTTITEPEVVDPDPEYVAFIGEIVETYGTETDPISATVAHDQMPPKWSTRYSVTHTKAVLVDLAKAGQINTARGGRYYPKETT